MGERLPRKIYELPDGRLLVQFNSDPPTGAICTKAEYAAMLRKERALEPRPGNAGEGVDHG